MRPSTVHATGLGLFLFIPLVLYLFVRHPEPVGASLALGVALMLGHRFVARPFMEQVRERRCLWCARVLATEEPRLGIEIATGEGSLPFVACPEHEPLARRFFSWLDRMRVPLRLGIALPLLTLLAALLLAALGDPGPLAIVTELFRLLVGLTVHLAALGATLGAAAPTPRAAFPLHNFTLLGVRNLLWIFRLVGVWWIVGGAAALYRLLAG